MRVLCHGVDSSPTVAPVCMLLAPDYVPARMGLQESDEPIPGECSPEGIGRKEVCVFGRIFPQLSVVE